MEDWIYPDNQKSYVSVIIPCHNERRFLETCLNSVLRQQYRPIEIIMVDDGSTDSTRSIMQEFEKRSEEGINVTCIFQEKSGAPAARNAGCRLSQGEFIQFLDGDDVLSANKLLDQVKLLNDMPEVDVVYGDGQYLIQLSNGKAVKGRIISISPKSDILGSMLEGQWVPLFSFLSRRSAISKCGPWDTSMPVHQDYEYFLRMAIQCCSFQFCNGNTGFYRKHDSGRLSEQDAILRGRTRLRIISNAENTLRDRRALKENLIRAIVESYRRIARMTFPMDVECFSEAIDHVLELCPQYRPRSLKARIGYLFLGLRSYEKIAALLGLLRRKGWTDWY